MLLPRFSLRDIHRRRRSTAIILLLSLALIWSLLPYDHAIRLALRFHLSRFYQPSLTTAQFVAAPPPFPITPSADVILVIKSGYGTQDRAVGWMRLLAQGFDFDDFLLVSDFDAGQQQDSAESGAPELPVHNVVKSTIQRVAASSSERYPRASKFTDLTNAIESGELDTAHRLAKEFGWELDAMKFISSLELAYTQAPQKKWYILIDDDTYLIESSLRQFLCQFDANDVHYFGNVIGSWDRRFAHGGSGIILSRAAMSLFFDQNPGIVQEAHIKSMTASMGDVLLAETLIKVGIYVEEGYGKFFNGEPPAWTKISADRFCTPIISFHGLKTKEALWNVHESYEKMARPSLWADVWRVYGASTPSTLDHVGRVDEHTTTLHDLQSADACQKACQSNARACLAWTWELNTLDCHLSAWMIVGDAAERKTSGLNAPRLNSLVSSCEYL